MIRFKQELPAVRQGTVQHGQKIILHQAVLVVPLLGPRQGTASGNTGQNGNINPEGRPTREAPCLSYPSIGRYLSLIHILRNFALYPSKKLRIRTVFYSYGRRSRSLKKRCS